MSEEIDSGERRDHTAGVPGHVTDPVPVRRSRRDWISRDAIVERLRRAQADPGLRADLALLVGETTDDLPPIR